MDSDVDSDFFGSHIIQQFEKSCIYIYIYVNITTSR